MRSSLALSYVVFTSIRSLYGEWFLGLLIQSVKGSYVQLYFTSVLVVLKVHWGGEFSFSPDCLDGLLMVLLSCNEAILSVGDNHHHLRSILVLEVILLVEVEW